MILTYEQIRDMAYGPNYYDWQSLFKQSPKIMSSMAKEVARAQHAADVEWLVGQCITLGHHGIGNHRRHCYDCWQEFKEGKC